MKIIFLTQYYPPEKGAPQNRLSAMARGLAARGAEVTVLTAMPNYPEMRVHEGYRRKWSVRERIDGIDVRRVALLVSARRSIFWRLCNYFSFVLTSLLHGLFTLRRSDMLLVESPPLFLGITAMLLARAKRAKLVFNVSDLWPESAVQLGLVTNRTMISASTWLEMRCYRRSALITGQTQGIVADIRKRCPDKQVVWIPNAVDLKDIEQAEATCDRAAERAHLNIAPNAMVFAYAGIHGHAQGLEVVLHAAQRLRDVSGPLFLFIGDGPEKPALMEMAQQLGLTNVRFIPGMPRTDLLRLLAALDGTAIPLRKNDLFKGAIPSKIFESLALAKPIVLGVQGEAHDLFIQQGCAGIAFTPEDDAELASAIRRYVEEPSLLKTHGEQGRRYVRENFEREKINERLWTALRSMEGVKP